MRLWFPLSGVNLEFCSFYSFYDSPFSLIMPILYNSLLVILDNNGFELKAHSLDMTLLNKKIGYNLNSDSDSIQNVVTVL